MSRRSLDLVIATGGALFALLLVVLALVVRNEGQFANDTVTQQLTEQKITFTPAEKLTAEEQALPGAVQYAGQPLTTGKQAEAYASIIALHLEESAKKAGFPGETYGSIGTVQTDLRAQVAQAKAQNDTVAATEAQKKAQAQAQQELGKLTGGMNLPFKLPF